MKSLIALTAVVLSVSPASARCGLLSWSHDDTCAGPFQPKPVQEVLAKDMAWCKAQMPGQISTCLDALNKRRIAEENQRLKAAAAIGNALSEGMDNASRAYGDMARNPPRSTNCTTMYLGGGMATTNCY